MSGDGPFFLSDPRPEHWQSPDPRPEHWQSPDPRPEHWQSPDPRPEHWQSPDPRPEHWQSPDPRPEHWQSPDPAALGAVRYLERRGWRCGPPCPPPPCGPRGARRRAFPMRYSGRVILRLSSEVDLASVDDEKDLKKAALKLGLEGLARLLEQFDVQSGATGRLVDVHEPEEPRGCLGLVAGGLAGRARREGAAASRGDQAGPGAKEQALDEVDVARRRPESIHDLERRAAGSLLPPLHSLASYWRVDLRDQPRELSPSSGELRLDGWKPGHEHTVRQFVRGLGELPGVDLAYRELAATDPAADLPPEDMYARVQEYLDRAPVGVDARWAWRHAVTKENLVQFVDLEQGWISHEDLPGAELIFGDNRHHSGETDEDGGGYRGHHGTAVLGEILGRHDLPADPTPPGPDESGICGIAPGPRTVRLASHWSEAERAPGNVANAIRYAIPRMRAGDVLLLEVQRSYLPTEIDDADRDAIRLAVASGIIVIEAAGNGNADLDRYVNEEGERVLARFHPEFRESGALMVGAARAARPHDRLAGKVGVGSNYGSRVDCFAHGDRVVSTGYGDMNDYLEPEDVDEDLAADRAYTASFGGTSGAAPIIAGAALLVQELRRERAGALLSPWEMRRLLADPATGTHQGRGVPGWIGIMPDLRRVLRDRLGLASDLYLRSGPDDDGRVPVTRPLPTSPDILLARRGEAAPDPLDDACRGLDALAPGSKYAVRLRMRNRGAAVARPVVRLFRSPVATLLTPDLWTEIELGSKEGAAGLAAGGAPMDPVAVGGPPAWSPEIAVPSTPAAAAALAPGDGPKSPDERYALVAIVRDALDEQIVEPPNRWPYFDWRRFRSFLRWHNGVACCNVHRVAIGEQVTLPFLVTGTPELARTFALEIVRDLPAGVSVALEAQAALASQLRRGRLWAAEKTGDRSIQVRLKLPTQPRVLVEGVRLVAEARFPCRLRLAGKGLQPGHGLAIRQLLGGSEVGRITWRFC